MNRFQNCKAYFEPHIYDRGMDIVQFADTVTIEVNKSDKVFATVQGTKLYDVRIEIVENEVLFSCNCPYADAGNMCKHMAAVIIVADQPAGQGGTLKRDSVLYQPRMKDEYDEQKRLLKERIRTVNSEDLHDFIVKAMLNDEALKRAFLIQFMSDAVDVNHMVDTFNLIVDSYLDYDGFISYRRAGAFFDEIFDFMDDLQALLNQGQIIEVAEILSQIIIGFDEISLDDSDGGSTEFYTYAEDMIKDILEEDVSEANGILHKWMKKAMENPNSWYLKEWVEPYWSAQYSEEELVNIQIENFERIVDNDRETGNKNQYSYSFIHNLIELVRLKEQRGDPESEIQELLRPYDKSDKVIWYLIKIAQRHENILEEENLLKRGIEQSTAQQLRESEHEFRVALCRFYQKHNNEDRYRECLEAVIINYENDLSFYKEYKSLYNKCDWEDRRKYIISKINEKKTYGKYIADIYVEEDMVHNLYEWLKANKELSTLKNYHSYLGNMYSDEILSLFIEALDTLALRTGSKGHYKNIVNWMKYIRTLTGGQIAMLKRAKQYRHQYKRRRNFMAELERLQ